MRRIVFLVAVLVLLLGIPAVVKAKPPDELGPLASVQYVDQAIADTVALIQEKLDILSGRVTALEGGGGGGVDFVPAQGWIGSIVEGGIIIEPTTPCLWNETEIHSSSIQVRAIAHLPNNGEKYGSGTCASVYFEGVEPVGLPGTLETDFWFWWMGKEKYNKYTVNTSILSCSKNCSSGDPNACLGILECIFIPDDDYYCRNPDCPEVESCICPPSSPTPSPSP